MKIIKFLFKLLVFFALICGLLYSALLIFHRVLFADEYENSGD